MSKQQVKTLIKAVATDLKLFLGLDRPYYMSRAKDGLERLRRAKASREVAIDKHDLDMLQLKVEQLTIG